MTLIYGKIIKFAVTKWLFPRDLKNKRNKSWNFRANFIATFFACACISPSRAAGSSPVLDWCTGWMDFTEGMEFQAISERPSLERWNSNRWPVLKMSNRAHVCRHAEIFRVEMPLRDNENLWNPGDFRGFHRFSLMIGLFYGVYINVVLSIRDSRYSLFVLTMCFMARRTVLHLGKIANGLTEL